MSQESNKRPALFELERVSLSLNHGRCLFRNVSLAVGKGEFLVLRGPSGAGKSSFLRLFNRLDEPSEGRILIEGTDVARLPVTELRRRVVYLHQVPVLLEGSIRENLSAPFRFKSAKGRVAPDDSVLEAWLTRFSLTALALGHDARSCSVGEKQRVCLLRALMLNPDMLLLDEPTSALDPPSARIVEGEILRANRDQGITMLMVTHRETEGDGGSIHRRLYLSDGELREV